MRQWDIYEITTQKSIIHGVQLRGRLRKFAIESNIELLTENATDADNTVRFAISAGSDPGVATNYILSVVNDAAVRLVRPKVTNPVLSKLKVNIAQRYSI